jgi:hypothetical protein
MAPAPTRRFVVPVLRDGIQLQRQEPPRLPPRPGGSPADPGPHGATRPSSTLMEPPPPPSPGIHQHIMLSALCAWVHPDLQWMASFLQTRITYLRCSPALSRRPSSLHAVKPLYTARHPRGPGRSQATRSPPDRLGPTRSTGGPLGSG